MRTITVVFSDKVLPLINLETLKTYKFLCNYDNIKAYDIITDPRYTGKMLVIGTSSCTDRVQGDIVLKDIYITEVNGHTINQPAGLVQGSLVEDVNKQRNNMEEKRNIKVTLEQAIEWYNSDNATLRTLALSAYTENELKFNFQYISKKVHNTFVCVTVPANENKKYKTLADLAIIAKYFNGNWKKKNGELGCFLGKHNPNVGIMVAHYNDVGVYEHKLQSAGTVYFKNKEDAVNAIRILGKEVYNLFD